MSLPAWAFALALAFGFADLSDARTNARANSSRSFPISVRRLTCGKVVEEHMLDISCFFEEHMFFGLLGYVGFRTSSMTSL